MSTQPKLQSGSLKQYSSEFLKDDLNFQDLEPAIDQSIRFYKRLSKQHKFHYGDLSYTATEMIASLELFKEIIRIQNPQQRHAELQEKFLIFESINTEGQAFFTGYYEPIIPGRLKPSTTFNVALYRKPKDLIRVDLSLFRKDWTGKKIVGKMVNQRLEPYDSREEIVYKNSLQGRGEPIVYVNEVEQFFLQIQGSGLVRLASGELVRLNYMESNGHPYRAIGYLLRDKIPREQMSLQALKHYLYQHPEQIQEILSYNPSYTFFREVEEGPLGNIEVPLTAKRSIAMDAVAIPKGSLAFIQTEQPWLEEEDDLITWEPIQRFAVVQDTGGAIRGHGRVDLFWGNGAEAELRAGYMKRAGRVFLLVARKAFLKSKEATSENVASATKASSALQE